MLWLGSCIGTLFTFVLFGCDELGKTPGHGSTPTQNRAILVGGPEIKEPTLIKHAEGFVDACVKARWQLRLPCITMDLSGDLQDRDSVIKAIAAVRQGLVYDEVGTFTVVGFNEDRTIRWATGTKSEDSLTACLQAGWSAQECGHIQLQVVGLGLSKLSILLKATERPAVASDTTDSHDIRGLQVALKEAGFNPGPLDGVMGPSTQNALRRYQERNGLHVTGVFDRATKQKLGL